MATDSIDVTAVGEVLVDFVAPDVEHLSSATSFIRTAGGAPANVAVAVATLDGRAGFVGAVGQDPFGVYLEGVLSSRGVDTAGLSRVAERTTLAFVAQNRGGIPDFVFYRGADAALRAEDLPEDMLVRSRFVHVGSVALTGEPSRAATFAAVDMAHRAGRLVSVDPNLRPSSWRSLDEARKVVRPLLDAADVLKVNDEEALLFTGESSLEAALGRLGRERRLVVVTRGSEGCLWSWRGETGAVAAPQVVVADTTGAGDAFVGALLAELCARGYTAAHFVELRHEGLEEMLRFACAAGAFSTTQPGAMASLPTRKDVEELLESST